MASKKKGRKKASKKVSKKVSKRRTRKKTSISIPRASLSSELGLLHKIDKKVTRIDRTVNAGIHLRHKARKAKHKSDLDTAWAEREESGYE